MTSIPVDPRHQIVVEAMARLSDRLPEGTTMAVVARADTEQRSAKALAAIAEQGATDDAVCVFCGARCWWAAMTRSQPGPLATACTDCVAAEVKKLREERTDA